MSNLENTYFLSDIHFGHDRIRVMCPETRKYNSVSEMDEAFIQTYNAEIPKGAVVYNLGDFSWHRDHSKNEELFSRLNGDKHLIVGNHDPKEVRSLKWSSVSDYKELRIENYHFVLFHYPIFEWNGFWRQSIHLYGHVHGALQSGRNPKLPSSFLNPEWRQMDVGIDGHFNRPVSAAEIVELMKDRKNS